MATVTAIPEPAPGAPRMSTTKLICHITRHACLIAWVFLALLSNTLFADILDVTASTGFATCMFAGMLLTWLGAWLWAGLSNVSRWSPLIPSTVGMALLALATVACGAVDKTGSLTVYCLAGFMTGIGLALAVSSLVLELRLQRRILSTRTTAVTAIVGCALFLLTSAFLPQNLQVPALCVYAIVALMTGVVANMSSDMTRATEENLASVGRARAENEASGWMLDEGILADISSNRLFPTYAVLGGFLLGYWYNIYPKTTHFAGTHTDAVLGTVSLSSLLFLGVLTVMTLALVALGQVTSAEKRRIYAGSLLIVVLAATYFSLPLMPQGTFGMLMSVAVLVASPAIAISLFSARTANVRKAFGQLALIGAGAFLGSLIAMGLIEVTRTESVVVVPAEIQTAMIVGIITIALTVEAVVGFSILNALYYPAPREVQIAVPGSPETNDIAESLATRFGLTPREQEVLELLLIGRSGSYISEELCLSKSTVKTHIRHIYAKMGISSKQQLIDLARS